MNRTLLDCNVFVDYKDDELDAEEEAQEQAHDERRWKLADTNGDGMLDKQEYSSFSHPEEAAHMKESLIQVGARVRVR